MNKLYRHIVSIKLPIIVLIVVSIAVVFSVAVVDKIYADEVHVARQVGFYGTWHKEEKLPSISVLPRPGVGGSGDAIPYSVGQEGLSDFNKVESLVNFLYENIYDNNGNEHKKAGATYIVCTMLGQKTFQDCEKSGYSNEYRQILSAGWTELRLRLHNPDIEISWYEYLPFENFINTMYDPDDNDVYYYTRTETTTRYTIIIRDKADKTKVYYRLFRQCANPIGGIDGLPVVTSKQWSLHATSTSSVNGGASSAETKDAKPSDTITWNHNLYNNNDSLSATTMGISSNLGITGFNSANYTKSDGYSNPGVGPGAIVRTISGDYSTHKVVQDDVGKKLCERVQYDPQNSDNKRDGYNESSCVEVPYSFNLTATTRIEEGGNKPNSLISFHHLLTNVGATKSKEDVNFHTLTLRINSAENAKPNEAQIIAATDKISEQSFNAPAASTGTDDGNNVILKNDVSKDSTYLITQADVGNWICGYMYATPRSSGSQDTVRSFECQYIPYEFKLTAVTTIADKYNNNTPGSYISFLQKLTNDGPTKTSRDVNFSTLMLRVKSTLDKKPKIEDLDGVAEITGKRAGFKTTASDTGNNNGSSVLLKNDNLGKDAEIMEYKITPADVGNWICGYMVATPMSDSSPDKYVKSYECQYIPYEYILTPTVTVNPSGVIENGTEFTVTANISKSGGTESEPATWNLSQSTTMPISNNSIGSDSNIIFKVTDTVVQNITVTASGDPGKHYCYVLSVEPHSNEDPGKIYSAQVCVVIGKKPKVQVWGGDLISDGKVSSSTSIKNGAMFGSWVEYGIFAGGLIKGTASGSAFADKGLASDDMCKYSMLSFAIVGDSTSCPSAVYIGKYKTSLPVTDIGASFPGNGEPISNRFVPNNVSEGVHIYSASDLTLDASEMKPNKTVIIKASGTVTINGNQTYSSDLYTNISNLPQLVIIAKNIIINGGVEKVDAWLVAKVAQNGTGGSIKTCDVVGDTIKKCDRKLAVNGPVIAKKLYLYRTAGAENDPETAIGNPAEVFNLRADAYLWATARANVNNKIQTVYTTELPPRL